MRKTGPDLLQAVGAATIRCQESKPGADREAAKEALRAAIRELAPVIERDRDFRSRGTVHGIADRYLSGVEVARLLVWKGEPTE